MKNQKALMMKRILSLILVAAIGISYSYAQTAQENTKNFINKTTTIMKYAKEKVQEVKVKNGHMAKAADFQTFAIKFYKLGEYRKAMIHSIQARKFAFKAINDNRGTIDPAWEVKVSDVTPPIEEETAKKVIEQKNKEVLKSLESELDPEAGKKSVDERANSTFETL
ncbi:MAG: hypothetical protein KKA07_14795 [Bacteroidetes bacterium]|nr:hypothetical protein [Bacteroidota bacterium]MBU1720328.1 hypothetical protein [Bacteroidota bacterium]